MPNKVVSKYFATETVMDDSLSDFKVKKKYNIGPKNVKKTSGNKKSKRIKGQKDIRKLIKKQENEVLSYSKDFDKVCKQVGVDVDSEELQLAITLSKSLHEVKKESSSEIEIKTTQNSSFQQRVQSIKTTLQEYGFKAYKTSALVGCSKKSKKQKRRSLYKLIKTTETERQQIISDKYSEILARNIYKSPVKVIEYDYKDRELYYKTTNIGYEHIKNNDVYYIKDLFEISPHRSCLRDWSEIPGRPLSPVVEVKNINFDDIIFDQNELDCILSGSIHTAQHIVTNKNTNISYNNKIVDNNIPLRFNEPKSLGNEVGFLSDEASCHTKAVTMSVSQVRCASPDLFDDEVSSPLDCMDNDVQVSGQDMSITDNINTYSMDLTECVNIDSYNSKRFSKIKLDNDINITNRRSNDFMEITNCMSNSLKQRNLGSIDLTETTNDLTRKTNNDAKLVSPNDIIPFMDLTQIPDFEAPTKNNTKEDNLHEDTIILVEEEYDLKCHQKSENLTTNESNVISINNRIKANSDQYDCDSYRIKNDNCFSRACKSDGTINFADETDFKVAFKKSEIDSITKNNREDIISTNSFKADACNSLNENDCQYEDISCKIMDESSESTNDCQPNEIDLTQTSNSSKENSTKDNACTSLNENNCQYEEISCKLIVESSEHTNDFRPNEIDLTQSSKESYIYNISIFNNQPISRYSLSLGKRDNISIDYDEIYDAIVQENSSHTSLSDCCKNQSDTKENDANKSDQILNDIESAEVFGSSSKDRNCSLGQSKHENLDFRTGIALDDENGFMEKEINNDIASNESKSSEVFEISDKEFNYSLHQSKLDNFDFRDVSVMNDLSNVQNNYNCENASQHYTNNKPLCENNSITRNIACNRVTQSHFNTDASTPIRSLDKNIKNVLQTPKNGDYIIKTTEVTPMLDYESMTSPERHKELEKYGLKPFKRKRAIQLLTYLYNQTHPIVDSHIDDCSSPSKRLKIDDKYQHSTTKSTCALKIINNKKDQQSSSTKPLSPVKLLKIDNNDHHSSSTKPLSPLKLLKKDNKDQQSSSIKTLSPLKLLKKDNKDQQSNSIKTLSPLKLLKKDNNDQHSSTIKPLSPTKRLKKDDKNYQNSTADPNPELNSTSKINNENYLYVVTNEHPDIRNIECDTEEWIFQKREKAKLHSCRVPLHIAFHNYVTCRRRLWEAILRYEPVNIDVIYKDMVATGYRYNPKDLLKFMDRKCITVRTADNNARNRKS